MNPLLSARIEVGTCVKRIKNFPEEQDGVKVPPNHHLKNYIREDHSYIRHTHTHMHNESHRIDDDDDDDDNNNNWRARHYQG